MFMWNFLCLYMTCLIWKTKYTSCVVLPDIDKSLNQLSTFKARPSMRINAAHNLSTYSNLIHEIFI